MSKVSPMSASIANAVIEKSVRMKEKEKRATFWRSGGGGTGEGGPADCGGRKEDKKKEKKKRKIDFNLNLIISLIIRFSVHKTLYKNTLNKNCDYARKLLHL